MDDWLFLWETVRASWTAAGKPSRVTVAVSGGADSVALLQALHALSGEESIFLTAAHVNHGLRESAGLDAEFVRKMCERLCVPCRVCNVQV
ncbi:MAG: tRNA(Ile)-lysidine synthetase, partial [Clostridia bacterium]|nr:tRNA(Ile)-lysidine synthetase [Clostridia bacterium]